MLKLCGNNEYSQLGEKSNYTSNTKSLICPSLNSHLNANSISSFSIYNESCVVITKNYEILAAGKNTNGRIIKSLPENIKEFTKFEIKDKDGQQWYPISAVCGEKYTLYMVSSTKGGDKKRLCLCHIQIKSDNPVFLNIKNSNPIAIYGGIHSSACITTTGSIIIIDDSIFLSPTKELEEIHLPQGEKAVSVSCCFLAYYAVDSSGKLYESKIKYNDDDCEYDYDDDENKRFFTQIEALHSEKVVEISGIMRHALALTEEGRVFGIDSNSFGKLGLGESKLDAEKFTEISSLSKYKITAVSAGLNHSLFLTNDGKVLACGSNENGQLFSGEPCSESFYTPKETEIKNDATFCIAGCDISAVFIGTDPLMSPNRRVKRESKNLADLLKKAEDEIARLKEENSMLLKKLNFERKKNENSKSEKLFELEIYRPQKIDQLKVVRTIGRGSQSEVFEVSRDQNLVLKVLYLDGVRNDSKSLLSSKDSESLIQLKKIHNIYQSLLNLNHPNIIRSFGFCYGDEKHAPSILLQFCPNNLSEVVEDMEDYQRICAIFEICSAMAAVHETSIIHSNLKPKSILFDEYEHVKISNFGICGFSSDDKNDNKSLKDAHSDIDYVKFMAPEILNENETFDNKVDVYSFGVVLFFILTKGKIPTIKAQEIVKGKKAAIPNCVNKMSRDLIRKCWSFDPKERPSFAEIVEIIMNNNFGLIDGVDKNMDEIRDFLAI